MWKYHRCILGYLLSPTQDDNMRYPILIWPTPDLLTNRHFDTTVILGSGPYTITGLRTCNWSIVLSNGVVLPWDEVYNYGYNRSN